MGDSFRLNCDPTALLTSVPWRATYQEFYILVQNMTEKLNQGEQSMKQLEHRPDMQNSFWNLKTQTEKQLENSERVITKQYYELVKYERLIISEHQTFLEYKRNYDSILTDVSGAGNPLRLIELTKPMVTSQQKLNDYMKLFKEYMWHFEILQESITRQTISYTYQYNLKKIKVIDLRKITEKIMKLTLNSQPMQPTANGSEQPTASSNKQPTANGSEQPTASSSEQPTASCSK